MIRTNTPELVSTLRNCSYTDFVGLIAQTNVPPGAFSTINRWVLYSHMTSASYLYEAACTTGFSLREAARLAGCAGEGADISEASVLAARRSVEGTGLGEHVSYHHANAVEHQPARKPTHIIVGAALRFFPDPERMVARCAELFGDDGYLLAAPFYTVRDIPQALLDEAKGVLGIVPTTARYKEVTWLYRGFQLLFEDRELIEMETRDELVHYCESTASRAIHLLDTTDREVYQAIYDRLFEIKDLCNRLRAYQGYSTMVLRYRASEFPNRYVELF
ncbi:MAG: class I SAM-dependent methyltransferase [Pseudomonadota bacterium]|nr:class I SAM-dependent methyltransferase [Pseudomonadota bacterium]